jgi:hypothetical protein
MSILVHPKQIKRLETTPPIYKGIFIDGPNERRKKINAQPQKIISGVVMPK